LADAKSKKRIVRSVETAPFPFENNRADIVVVQPLTTAVTSSTNAKIPRFTFFKNAGARACHFRVVADI
jgi:hypothetical protein